jgi:3-oxoacyl-[acyl-carrier protein] reductase
MALNLRGKNALVTGGSRGIGRAIAEKLLSAGAAVAICGKDAARLQRAVEEMSKSGGRVVGKVADVAKLDEVQSLFQFVDKELGQLDILVNNAGLGKFATVADMDPAAWNEVIGTNLTGVYYCTREAARRMKNHGGGSIIMISSLAQKNPFSGGAAYNASKFGLGAFSEALLLDHRYDGIRICSILPGSVNTEFGHTQQAEWKIQPEDIANVVEMVLAMPERTMVSHVEVRPSRPPKK